MTSSSIIFDLDGTLLDTLTGLAAMGNEVLQNQGFPSHPKESYKTFIGDGLYTLINRIVPKGSSRETIERGCEIFSEIYADNWKQGCSPYPGVVELLKTLNEETIPLGILSNKPDSLTQLSVNEFFEPGTFTLVRGERKGYPKKPDPTVALDICSFLGSTPDNCFFVGDSGVDMQTGSLAGMKTIGVAWGFRSVQELNENGADTIVYNTQELLRYVLSNT